MSSGCVYGYHFRHSFARYYLNSATISDSCICVLSSVVKYVDFVIFCVFFVALLRSWVQTQLRRDVSHNVTLMF